MKTYIKIQIVITLILALIGVILLLGIYTDIKYSIEPSKEVTNDLILSVYNIVNKLGLLFFILVMHTGINYFILLKKSKSNDQQIKNE